MKEPTNSQTGWDAIALVIIFGAIIWGPALVAVLTEGAK